MVLCKSFESLRRLLQLHFVIADLFTSTFSRIPEDYVGRRNLECVETLHENPLNPRQVLIGYSRGLMVLWDMDRQRPIQHFLGTQVPYTCSVVT